MNRLSKELLFNSKFYSYWFGGDCTICKDPIDLSYIIFVSNTDIKYCQFKFTEEMLCKYGIRTIFNKFCDEYLAIMRYNNSKYEDFILNGGTYGKFVY